MTCFRQRGQARAMIVAVPRLHLLAVVTVLVAAGLSFPAEAERADQVGRVTKVENEVQVVSVAGAAVALIGTEVHMQDELRTGQAARLQVTFRDDSVLTLSENARVRIDRYVYDPDRGIGEAVLQAAAGAFRLASGQMKDLKDRTILVSTPVAQIGVRGTEFWGGPIDGKYGVFLIAGEVTVTTEGGSITLSVPGQGTDIPSPLDPPGPQSAWPVDKVARAVASVALH